jgi:hypothetical protein
MITLKRVPMIDGLSIEEAHKGGGKGGGGGTGEVIMKVVRRTAMAEAERKKGLGGAGGASGGGLGMGQMETTKDAGSRRRAGRSLLVSDGGNELGVKSKLGT